MKSCEECQFILETLFECHENTNDLIESSKPLNMRKTKMPDAAPKMIPMKKSAVGCEIRSVERKMTKIATSSSESETAIVQPSDHSEDAVNIRLRVTRATTKLDVATREPKTSLQSDRFVKPKAVSNIQNGVIRATLTLPLPIKKSSESRPTIAQPSVGRKVTRATAKLEIATRASSLERQTKSALPVDQSVKPKADSGVRNGLKRATTTSLECQPKNFHPGDLSNRSEANEAKRPPKNKEPSTVSTIQRRVTRAMINLPSKKPESAEISNFELPEESRKRKKESETILKPKKKK